MKRPTSVTVFGILSIGFSILNLIGLVFSLLTMGRSTGMPNPMLEITRDQPVYAAWFKFSVGLGFVSSILLLVCGIGLLKLKPWARTVVVYYAIASIVLTLLGGFINHIYVTKPLLEKASRAQGPEKVAYLGGAYGGLVGVFFGIVYNSLFLFYMTRPKVQAAFESPVYDAPPLPPS